MAVALTQGFAALPNTEVALSLARDAELLRGPSPPRCDLVVDTYANKPGFMWRLATSPFAARSLARRIASLRPDVAVCAQPGPLDLLMAMALRRLRIPFVVLVHDADHHPGDGQPLQMRLQQALCRRADAVGALSTHVAERLIAQGLTGQSHRPLIRLRFPPLPVAMPEMAPARRDGLVRLLSFGRLLPYKGLDLLADALTRLGPQPRLHVRVIGSGPESTELNRLRALPNVTVENAWVPEAEIGTLLAWSDALVLPYREASQSGVAALALSAGRRVISTNVGGLAEQLGDEPLATLCAPEAGSLAAALQGLLDAPEHGTSSASQPVQPDWSAVAQTLLQECAKLPRHPRTH